MKKIFSEDKREATGFANYPNPVTMDGTEAFGPNTLGEMLWPVEISEDGKRVGFSLIAPEGATQ